VNKLDIAVSSSLEDYLAIKQIQSRQVPSFAESQRIFQALSSGQHTYGGHAQVLPGTCKLIEEFNLNATTNRYAADGRT
jgi:hypothetical protein